jgi:hypothetical protein
MDVLKRIHDSKTNEYSESKNIFKSIATQRTNISVLEE